MGLGLQTGGGSGEVRPYINYDAKAGRAFRIDRSQSAGGEWQSNKVDITRILSFIPDLANIKVGWINYSTQGPIRRLATLGKEPIPARPEDKTADGKSAFKQGFEMTVLLGNDCGGPPVREFSSTAGCVIEAIDQLHDAYTAAAESKQGKLPVVKLVDTVPIKSGQSTNYKPVFEIIAWKDRPVPLAESGNLPLNGSAPKAAATPPATGSTQVAPPTAKQAPQPTTAEADNFG